MASGVKEPLQSRLDGLVFRQKFLRVENLIAARPADIASQAFVKAEHQMAAHAIQSIKLPGGVKDRVTDLLTVGQSHQLLGIGPRAPEFLEGGVQRHAAQGIPRSEEHTSELQSHVNLVCRLLLEKKNAYIAELARLPAS